MTHSINAPTLRHPRDIPAEECLTDTFFLLHSLERPMLARMSWCNIHRRDVLSLRAVRIQSLRLERDDCSGSGALLHNGVPLG
jgi:hypothetical protein